MLRGKAHVYRRDHINTDEIIPARYLTTDNEQELAAHAMEDLDRSFAEQVSPGDIIVASHDFGCGSSREHAVWALHGAGVACVVADSFARIFYRNAVNNGFAVVECPGIADNVSPGHEIEIDLKAGVLKNLSAGTEFTFIPLPKFAFEIAEAGGLLEAIKKP